jgi:predicted nucleotide-binding protein (sugar kinase/HSP70/actin superfamily)
LEKLFGLWAWIAGLRHFHLPNMEHLAAIAHEYYPVQLRGGEGHMEVGKVIDTFARKKAHLVISVKPFGCMPSSGVSDGVQSMVTAKFPEANFCAIETSGDGAVSVYSRIQMALFKARARAKEEYEQAMSECGGEAAPGRKATSYAYYPRHVVAGTAANAVLEAGGNR